ncbi:MAG TPA: outer membrane protein assembly factor BamD [Geobacteraceae bacterium]
MSLTATRHAILILCCILLASCSTAKVESRPDVLFKEGEDLYNARRYEDAIAQWKRVKESYSSPELTTLAELKIADAQFDNQSYIEAAASYEEFRKLHPTHEQATYALYRLGLCHYKQITGIDTDQTPVKNAVIYFEEFLKKYPAASFAPEVKDKLADCLDKQLQYEIYVGRFYYRTEKYSAAIKRFEEALARFPKSPLQDETLYYLGSAYLMSGERDKARQTLNRLATDYPNSLYIDQARRTLEKFY